jgi:hypothetical protein
MLPSFGWPSSEFGCLNSLWQQESGWNPYAANPSSGAYGIPQALPGSKLASAGPDWQTSAATQIRWGLGYIRATYGSPCGAGGTSQVTAGTEFGLRLVLRSCPLGHHSRGVNVCLATRKTWLAAVRYVPRADIDRMYGCEPAVVCAVKMIFVTTILAPLTGFHQNAQVAAGQPWNVLLEMDSRW